MRIEIVLKKLQEEMELIHLLIIIKKLVQSLTKLHIISNLEI